METWDAIRARRNVRTFTDQPIPPADLDRIVEAAWRTPSSSNRQRWEFVVCTDRAQLEQLARVWRGAAHVAGSAATVALVCPIGEDERTRVSINYDLGQATMSIMLAAADAGIGSCHSAVTEYDLARSILGLPEDRQCAWLISLGYPVDRPLRPMRRPNRRPIEEVVRRGRW